MDPFATIGAFILSVAENVLGTLIADRYKKKTKPLTVNEVELLVAERLATYSRNQNQNLMQYQTQVLQEIRLLLKSIPSLGRTYSESSPVASARDDAIGYKQALAELTDAVARRRTESPQRPRISGTLTSEHWPAGAEEATRDLAPKDNEEHGVNVKWVKPQSEEISSRTKQAQFKNEFQEPEPNVSHVKWITPLDGPVKSASFSPTMNMEELTQRVNERRRERPQPGGMQ